MLLSGVNCGFCSEYCCRVLLIVCYCVMLEVTTFGTRTMAAEMEQYCFQENFNKTCPEGHVILIEKAKYGRMSVGKCLQKRTDLGCSADVTLEIAGICSGRRHCFISIPDNRMHNLAGCPSDQISYLAAAFICQKVTSPNLNDCRRQKPIEITDFPGYISGQVVRKPSHPISSFGSCKFRLTVPEGQKINITLVEFAPNRPRSGNSAICNVYAKVPSQDLRYPGYKLCGGNSGRNKLYTSSNNRVTLELMLPANDERPPFLLKYQAVGCADPVVPQGARFTRTGNGAVVECNHTGQTWHIVCRGNDWVGKLENCSDRNSGDDLKISQESQEFPFSLVIAVLIGVCIGVILGIALLCFVSCVLKQQRNTRARRYSYRDSNIPEHTMMLQSAKMYPCDHSYECTANTGTGTGPGNNNLPPTLPPSGGQNTQQNQPKIPQYVGNNLNECNMSCPCNVWNKCPEHHTLHAPLAKTTNQKLPYNDHKLPSLIKDSEESLQQVQCQQGHLWEGGPHVCGSGEDCSASGEGEHCDASKGINTLTDRQHIKLKSNDKSEDLILSAAQWPSCQRGPIETLVR